MLKKCLSGHMKISWSFIAELPTYNPQKTFGHETV